MIIPWEPKPSQETYKITGMNQSQRIKLGGATLDGYLCPEKLIQQKILFYHENTKTDLTVILDSGLYNPGMTCLE